MPTGIGGETGWWCPSLDDAGNGTNTLNDLVGTNHGTLYNMDAADWVNDTASGGIRALDLDGSNDYIEIPTAAGNVLEGAEWSFSVWMFLRANLSNGGMFSMDYGSPFPFSFRDNDGGGSWGVILNGSVVISNPGAISLNTWLHFVCVRTAAGTTLYRNGVSVATGSAGTVTASSQSILIGTDYRPATGRHINAKWDDLRLFSVPISAASAVSLASKRGYQPSPGDFESNMAGGMSGAMTGGMAS